MGVFETRDMIASDFKMKFADFMTHLVVSDLVLHAKEMNLQSYVL